MNRLTPDFLAILQTLVVHRVDFLVVGGICAVLHGAPIAMFDLDLVHSCHPDNIQLLGLLARNNPNEQSASVARVTTAPA